MQLLRSALEQITQLNRDMSLGGHRGVRGSGNGLYGASFPRTKAYIGAYGSPYGGLQGACTGPYPTSSQFTK